MVQSMVARRALDMQLKRVGILPPGEGIHDLAEFELVFKSLCECLCICARACVRIFRTRARVRVMIRVVVVVIVVPQVFVRVCHGVNNVSIRD